MLRGADQYREEGVEMTSMVDEVFEDKSYEDKYVVWEKSLNP